MYVKLLYSMCMDDWGIVSEEILIVENISENK